ncbi:unnamed protein product [Chironomus riparius]|uniref:Ionotropic receptor n=1 Tax=Chironomus riparius TaxID=315576 RepID=A0A9N9WZP7_9DIPT|nr:unnamed protein product [Chironomus riparius]
MKASMLLIYLITTTLICGAFSYNFDNLVQQQVSKLPKFICNVIKSAKREDLGLKIVTFVTTENKLEHSMIDDVIRCMPMDITTTLIDLRLSEGKIDSKAQIVVLLADQINVVMSSLLSANHMSKFLIITSDAAKLNPQNVQNVLNSNGIQNFAIIAEEGASVAVQRPETFNGEVKIATKLQKPHISSQIYPDKLKNLNGYKYKVVIKFDSTASALLNSQIKLVTSQLFESLSAVQNASTEIIPIVDITKLPHFDFIVNPKVTLTLNLNTIMLYSREKFCILIPKVIQSSNSNDLMSKNVSKPVKFLVILIYVSVYLLWRLCKNHGAVDEPSTIVLNNFAAYHDQGVSFSRNNHLILTIMIQVLMIMTIFLNLMNQWVIGIALSFPQGELSLADSLRVFNESQDTKLYVDLDYEEYFLSTVPNRREAKQDKKIKFYYENNFIAVGIDHKKTAFIGYCDFIKILDTSDEYVYKVYENYFYLYISVLHFPQNPLIIHVKTFISYAFEAGLTQYWNTMSKMKIYGRNFAKSNADDVDDDLFTVFGMNILKPIFSDLLQGLVGASFVLILEVFFYDFIQRLSWQLIRNWALLLVSKRVEKQTQNINWQNVGRIQRAWYFWKQRRNLKQLSMLPKFICNVTKSAKSEDSGLKTVAFVTTENKLEHSMIDDVMRCMPMNISTTLIDLRIVEGKMDIKAQLVVILSDQIDAVMSSLLSANHMSKFLIVTSDAAKLNPQNVQKVLNSNGIQNFAIIAEEGASVAVQRPETFNGEVKVVRELQKPHISSQIYPDKLKNLQGYKYKVAIDFRSYPITSRHNRIVQRTSHLFRTIARHQNATLKLIRVRDSTTFNRHNNNFCILMPKVNKFTARELLSPQKTDLLVSICLSVTYVSIFVIWRLFKGRGAVEAPDQIVFKFLGAFNGQSAHFSRKNRLVLRILIQLMMIMSIFTNIINQWNIGTSLAYPQGELSLNDTYKIFADHKDSKIAVDAIMDDVMPLRVRTYYRLKVMDRIVLFDERTFNLDTFEHQKVAVFGHCEFVKVMATQNQNFFDYPMPSILSAIQVNYGPQNPFADKIEELMKHAFEAGLPDVWETMIKMRTFGQNYQKSEAVIKNDIFDILGFDKLLPLFHSFGQGLGLAFAIFIIEILYHDCIRHLSWQLIRQWTSSMALRSNKKQKETINWQQVGRIQRACAKSEDSGLKIVAFVTTENKLEHSMIDDVMQCMPMDISTTLIDLRLAEGKMDIKAQLVVILSDQINVIQMRKLIPLNLQNSLITAETKILIITTDIAGLNTQKITRFLTNHGILNFAAIQEDKEVILAQRTETFMGDPVTIKIINHRNLTKHLFPHKLKNLNGYKYKIFMATSNLNRTNRIVQRISRLFRAIGQVQNSGRNLTTQNADGRWFPFAPYGFRKTDFLVGAEFSKARHPNSIPLYNRASFCASIPKVMRFSTVRYKLLTEYDAASMVCIIVSSLALLIIWKLYKGSDSGGSVNFALKLYGQYHGQSQQFSRQNPRMLTILIQIINFTTIVLSVYNQRMIGLTLANPHENVGIETSYKLFMDSTSSKMMIDAVLEPVMSSLIHGHENVEKNDRIVSYDEEKFDFGSFDRTKMSIIGHCDFVKILSTENEYFYKLDAGFHLSYTQISPGALNPHAMKIQTYINYAFEAGLTEIWETQAKMRIFRGNFAKSEAKIVKIFFEVLPFDKLAVVFSLLVHGCLAAAVLFMLEIFYFEFVRNLSWQLVRYWTTSIVSRINKEQDENINWQNVGKLRRAWYFWRQRRYLKVRRINVRAADV